MPPEPELWLDTHISPVIAKWMADYTGFTVKSSYSLQLHYLTDIEIYTRARQQGNTIIISKDVDFAELISRLGAAKAHHPQNRQLRQSHYVAIYKTAHCKSGRFANYR